uniref:G-protein coupled receptors family 1 profile domain-containing protein n=1 Tax=Glossina palpalis gambiensis TaxID=67801 RepID=A0A1B0BTM8_9MUSC
MILKQQNVPHPQLLLLSTKYKTMQTSIMHMGRSHISTTMTAVAVSSYSFTNIANNDIHTHSQPLTLMDETKPNTVTVSSEMSSSLSLTTSSLDAWDINSFHFDGNLSALTTTIMSTTTTAITTTLTNVSSESVEPSIISNIIKMDWHKAIAVPILMLLILVTVVGNTLVILAILTTRRLRSVTNCFILNLAITDWLVDTWRFGWILCDIWISLDILLCTASILSLCVISLDRYLAVTQPLNYSKNKRTKRLAFYMIFIVWITALCITCPPFFGWYEPGRHKKDSKKYCRYNQNKGYVVFSAMGSFFIPLTVMLYVYLKIGYVLTSRRQRIVRDATSERTADHEIDNDQFLSESEHFESDHQELSAKRCVLDGMNGKANSLKHFKNLNHQRMERTQFDIITAATHCSAKDYKYEDSIYMKKRAMSFCLNDAQITASDVKRYCINDGGGSKGSFSETCLTSVMEQQSHLIKHHCHHQQQHNHHHHHHHRVPMRISTMKRETKTTKTLSMVMGGFIICWLPFFIYYLLIPFLPQYAVQQWLMSLLTWIGWVNCAINPFIYAFYNPDFRAAFWRLTCRHICKPKLPINRFKV